MSSISHAIRVSDALPAPCIISIVDALCEASKSLADTNALWSRVGYRPEHLRNRSWSVVPYDTWRLNGPPEVCPNKISWITLHSTIIPKPPPLPLVSCLRGKHPPKSSERRPIGNEKVHHASKMSRTWQEHQFPPPKKIKYVEYIMTIRYNNAEHCIETENISYKRLAHHNNAYSVSRMSRMSERVPW